MKPCSSILSTKAADSVFLHIVIIMQLGIQATTITNSYEILLSNCYRKFVQTCNCHCKYTSETYSNKAPSLFVMHSGAVPKIVSIFRRKKYLSTTQQYLLRMEALDWPLDFPGHRSWWFSVVCTQWYPTLCTRYLSTCCMGLLIRYIAPET